MGQAYLMGGEDVFVNRDRRTGSQASLKVSKGGREYLLARAEAAAVQEPRLASELTTFPEAVFLRICAGCPGIIDEVLLVFWPARARGALEAMGKAVWMEASSLGELVEKWKTNRNQA